MEFTLDPADTWVGGPYSKCWAPDGAERNGKYYFYFSQGQLATGVAVSDNPEGPYIDTLGEPVLPADLTPLADYDPTVFIDDDDTPYIIWGGGGYYIARLNEDMISLAEAPQLITHPLGTGDAPYVHKHNGIYYLNQHHTHYASSTNVYGPYVARGSFKGYTLWQDHGGFFTWNNQNYYTFGIHNVDGVTDNPYRKTKIGYVQYLDNGDIYIEPFHLKYLEAGESMLGVGQYDPAWFRIQAEWYFAASDGLTKNEGGGGFEVRGATNGSYLFFPKIQNMTNDTSFSFSVSSANATGGTIEVREGSTSGTLLGSAVVPDTGSWSTYQVVTANLTNSAGTRDIYFVFKGSGSELLRLDYWKTASSPVFVRYEAEDAVLTDGAATNDNHLGYSGSGFVDSLLGNSNAAVSFTVDGGSGGSRDLVFRYSTGGAAAVLGLYINGQKAKDLTLSATPDWDSWADQIETISMPATTYTLTFVAESASVSVNIDYVEVDDSGTLIRPYHGSAVSIPGRIQMEDYDNGGEGVSYHDTDLINNYSSFRSDEWVDVEGTSDVDGVYNVGWVGGGEWLEYTVNTAAGTYDINLRYASMGAKTVTVYLDGSNIGVFNAADTGGWQTWQTATISGVTLTSGVDRILRVEVGGGGGPNMNWIEFSGTPIEVDIPPNLIGQWNFEGQNNTNSADTGSTFDGSLVGTGTYTNDTPPGIGSAYALDLNAAGSVLTINNTISSAAGYANLFDQPSFSVALWIKNKPEAEASDVWLGFANKGQENSSGWSLRKLGTGDGVIAGFAGPEIVSGTTVSDNTWHHLVLTVSEGTSAALWIDGQPAGGTSVSYGLSCSAHRMPAAHAQ